jgi:hypothetical protein
LKKKDHKRDSPGVVFEKRAAVEREKAKVLAERDSHNGDEFNTI